MSVSMLHEGFKSVSTLDAQDAIAIFRTKEQHTPRDQTSSFLAEQHGITMKAVRDIWYLLHFLKLSPLPLCLPSSAQVMNTMLVLLPMALTAHDWGHGAKSAGLVCTMFPCSFKNVCLTSSTMPEPGI